MVIAYFGPEATYTHQAAIRRFGASLTYTPQKTIADVFTEVSKGRADYGVVPVENSTEGIVTHTLDMLVDSDLKIDQPEARVILDRERLADLGFDLATAGRELGTVLGGAYVNRFNYFDRSYKVIPQIGDEDRTTVGPLLDLKIKSPKGELIPVSSFTHIETGTAPRSLNRFQQRNSVRVFGGVQPGVTKEEGLRVLENAAATAKGPRIVLDHAGESRQIRRKAPR